MGDCLLDQDLQGVLEGRPLTGSVMEPAARNTYWADPCVTGHRTDAWVFAEELERWRGLGHIVALHVVDGAVVSRRAVLAGQHHLSFPQIHRFEDGWIGTVETCDPDPRVYVFRDLGDPWTPTEWRLPTDLIDPALSRHHDGSWRLTATLRSRNGYGPVVTYASALTEPADWNLVDSADYGLLARSGGTCDFARGLRSVQDCSKNYGLSLSILRWPTERRSVLDIRGGDVHTRPACSWLGIHACAWNTEGTVVVVDLWTRRWQPLSAVHRWREFRDDPCRLTGG